MQRSSRQVFRIFLGVLIVVGSSIYLYTQLDVFLGGPSITITSPTELASYTQEEQVIITGVAKNVSALTLNGAGVAIDQNGEFSKLLLLSPGFNIMEVSAEDKFGRTDTQTRTFVYQVVETTTTGLLQTTSTLETSSTTP